MGKQRPKSVDGRPINYDNQQQEPQIYGPNKNRSCTDVICLILFLVFIVVWVIIGVWAILNGNPKLLLVPSDSHGLRCGFDEEVKDRSFLFFFDISKCVGVSAPILGCDTKQVCVEKCPTTSYFNGTGSIDEINAPYCDTYITGHNSEDLCPKYFLKSISIQRRCIPSAANLDEETLSKISPGNTGMLLENFLNAIQKIEQLSNIDKFAQQIIADLLTSWWKILIGIGLALVVSIIYILMLRWIAGIVVWISIIGAVAALTAGSYFLFKLWQYWKDSYADNPQISSSKTKRDIFLALFIILVSVLIIVVLVLIFLRKRIVLAIALIKEGSKAVSSVTSVLFFPIFPWTLQVGVISFSICVAVYLATIGEAVYQYKDLTEKCKNESSWSENQNCNVTTFNEDKLKYSNCVNATCRFAGVSNDVLYPYLQTINVFGFFWLAFFASAFGQMVLAQVFAQWYWTMKKRTLPFFAITVAFGRTLKYHIGTLAFGSLIIAICRMIRIFLEYIDRKLKKYDNEFTKAIMCCLKCFFWCLEKFLKFINKNAYIMCAIHGKNFCASAKDAFMLLMRNIIRVFVLDKVTDFLFFLSKLLVTAGIGAVAYIFFATDLINFMDNSELNFGLVPVISIMIATYFIATLFFSVYSMAVDTLFLCFLEDCEINDGKSRPYFMSRNLMKIFGKRNKIEKRD